MSDSAAPVTDVPTRRVYRIQAGSRPHVSPNVFVKGEGTRAFTGDTYQNVAARLGIGTDNMQSAGTYGFNPITRNRQLLEFMYRGSWLVGQACDTVAQDMTRGGLKLNGQFEDGARDRMVRLARRLGIWDQLEAGVKWGRLYGGGLVVHLVDGQDMRTPLDPRTVKKGQYRGLLSLDRWMVQPSFGDIVDELGPNLGRPRYWLCTANATALQGQIIHHSRVGPIDGIALPFWQAQSENFWGMSVVERIYDRLLAFDSTTQGTAQLVFKAYLRTYGVENLREILTGPTEAMEGLLKVLDGIRRFQSSEGLTLIDKSDTFETHTYQFSGLSDVLGRFAEQVSGAVGIPLVRLFGQSPGGFSTGEADLQNYYDLITTQQNSKLYNIVTQTYELLHYSANDTPPPEDFGIEFESLWQMSEKERAEVGEIRTRTILLPLAEGVTNRASALRELADASEATGVFGSITDADVQAAIDEPPPPGELPPPPAPGDDPAAEPAPGDPAIAREPERPALPSPPSAA